MAADLTEKNTLHTRAPFMRTTFADEAVDGVFPIWKTKRELGLFWPSSVSVPVIPTDEADR